MKPNLKYIFLTLILWVQLGKAQSFELGLDFGISSYYGDLAPYSWKVGVSGGDIATGLSLGVPINKHWTLKASYMTTQIRASDKNAIDSVLRRKRNLSFATDITEYGLTAEINLFSWSKLKVLKRIQPFAVIGLNYFIFNPTTIYKGEIVALQPLGTEGQGMVEYPDRRPYDLSQFNIPFGCGIKVYIEKHIWMGVGLKYRMTFTDYLDDVSNTYVDLSELARLQGNLSAQLAYRTDELSAGSIVPNGLEGEPRGNPGSNDWYLTSFLTIGYRWQHHKKKRNSGRYKKCPSSF